MGHDQGLAPRDGMAALLGELLQDDAEAFAEVA